MSAEPSEWHSFADSAATEAQPASGPSGATVRPQPISGAASHRRAWFAVGGTVLAVVAGLAVFVAAIAMAAGGRGDSVVIAARSDTSPRAGGLAPTALPSKAAAEVEALVVDVEGAVRSPGLHQVPAGSRIGDAIAAAGGYADRADLAAAAVALNLAEPVADGTKIRVPQLGEMSGPIVDLGPGPTTVAGPSDGHPAAGLIDLNHADQAALDGLPGIGPVTAGKIIAARESSPFASLDDVVNRKALTAGTLDKIRALVTVTP